MISRYHSGVYILSVLTYYIHMLIVGPRRCKQCHIYRNGAVLSYSYVCGTNPGELPTQFLWNCTVRGTRER